VYLSTNNGAAWSAVNTGLPIVQTPGLAATATTLLAGTGGLGVWNRSLSELITGVSEHAENIPSGLALEQNYPNPFNPVTRIEYALPNEAHVTLNVYNVLGQVVATLVNQVEQAGYKTVQFDVKNLSSGLYFYRLSAGQFSETRKMLIVR
jgi:hypothetical protein